MIIFFIVAAIAEIVNDDYLHWWQTTNADIAAIVLLVGAFVLMERRR